MLELKQVGFRREDWIFRDVNLSFEPRQIYGVIGKSGAGKSTLLKVMGGFLDVQEGKVLFNERRILGPTEKLVPGYDDIQLVNQDFDLELFHTVEENVKEKILSRHKKDQDVLIRECLELIELTDLKDRKAHELSGGEQQRLAIARALACEPAVLMLDEPFVHLDQRIRRKVMDNLHQLNEDFGTTIILVSHDGAEMMGFAETIIHLKDGKVERSCPAMEMYYNPNSIEEATLMGEINSISVDGKDVLFRPTEYVISEKGDVHVEFLRSIDTGLTIFNYFKTSNGERIILSSNTQLNKVRQISISKRL